MSDATPIPLRPQSLKPCPFCGCPEQNRFSHWTATDDGMIEIKKIQCVGCFAEAPERRWNARFAPTDAREALIPFAKIGLDILRNRPGWANHTFTSNWATHYPLKYSDFERAAAVVLATEKERV